MTDDRCPMTYIFGVLLIHYWLILPFSLYILFFKLFDRMF
jgi:hypothetical protein